MLKEYCSLKSLSFKQDGVLEVGTYDKGLDKLHNYLEWGYSNGLQKNEIHFLEKGEAHDLEPNVKCLGGIYCSKDGSVDYGTGTRELMEGARSFGCKLLTGSKVVSIVRGNHHHNNDKCRIALYKSNGERFLTKYLINTAGGNAVDIAHSMGVAREYTDLHFRGEYWQAPSRYRDLTKVSTYTVPKHPE